MKGKILFLVSAMIVLSMLSISMASAESALSDERHNRLEFEHLIHITGINTNRTNTEAVSGELPIG